MHNFRYFLLQIAIYRTKSYAYPWQGILFPLHSVVDLSVFKQRIKQPTSIVRRRPAY